jgi:hypothetical protein
VQSESSQKYREPQFDPIDAEFAAINGAHRFGRSAKVKGILFL